MPETPQPGAGDDQPADLQFSQHSRALLDFAQGWKTHLDKTVVPSYFNDYKVQAGAFEQKNGRLPAGREAPEGVASGARRAGGAGRA